MIKYRIISRYEYYSKEGIVWSKWFQVTFAPIADTEDELKPLLSDYKKDAKQVIKSTKRKIEYNIEKFDYQEIQITNKKRSRKKS